MQLANRFGQSVREAQLFLQFARYGCCRVFPAFHTPTRQAPTRRSIAVPYHEDFTLEIGDDYIAARDWSFANAAPVMADAKSHTQRRSVQGAWSQTFDQAKHVTG